MNQRILTLAGLALAVGGCYLTRPSTPVAQGNGEPIVTIKATPTSAPTIIPTLTAPTGDPVRVQFAKGAWSATLTGNASTDYLLWAAQGQTFTVTLTSDGTALASLYSVDDQPLYEQMRGPGGRGNSAAATLPASGDHTLEIRAGGKFTVEVEIR